LPAYSYFSTQTSSKKLFFELTKQTKPEYWSGQGSNGIKGSLRPVMPDLNLTAKGSG